ncbi:Fc receptor-like protein 3 isoform X3 [Tamandua tetradactyla]|uniref:Fc receptor-like protein 3 isoform X3 n=1 Tax=Tamandua tetradactyla TaxID=48850 RepID=UPI00405418A1
MTASGSDRSGAAPKAVLLIDPPWSPVFKGKKVTLTCRGSYFPAQGGTSWYSGRRLLREDSEKIQTKMSGSYQCKTQGSSLSDQMRVEFSSDWLILQVLYPVFEGDTVNLRCQGKEEEKITEKLYYKNGKELHIYKNLDFIEVKPWDNDKYYCTATGLSYGFSWTETSKPVRIQVQELFPHPMLIASSSWPTEGSPVTLKCETWLPPMKSDTKLQFCFFRGDQALEPGWSGSSELQIPTIWSEDSRSYWCEAEAKSHGVRKRSQRSQIYVQRVPVSDVNLEIQPPGGQVVEGENLLLVCSVAQGTGTVIFSWYKEGTVRSLGRKSQRSLSAELQVPNMTESDAGRYSCSADNIDGSIYSKLIEVTVRIPASHPILSLKTPRAQAVMGDVVELHCETQRGSYPILYQFYHEDGTLGNISVSSGRGASFNLSLTAEHSGNYSCVADNGLGAQHSEMVPLNVTGPSGNRTGVFAAGVIGGLLSVLGLATATALLSHLKTHKQAGGIPAPRTSSPQECQEASLFNTSSTNLHEPSCSETPFLTELQPVYSNVHPEESNLVYSQIMNMQHTKEDSANSPRMHQKDMEFQVIYSELKKAYPDDSMGQAITRDREQEDSEKNYENVP